VSRHFDAIIIKTGQASPIFGCALCGPGADATDADGAFHLIDAHSTNLTFDSCERIGRKNMENLKYDKESTAVLAIDPYNDFISEGGKLWDRLKTVAEVNHCVPHMLQVLNAARNAELRVFYALHRRYRPGD